MAHKQREGTPPSRNTGPARDGALGWAIACAALALAVAGTFLALYRIRGFRLPVGFDAPWYVWRSAFVAHVGLGPLGTATRPGAEVVGALLGGVTGRSALTVAVLLAPVLAGVFALALGALLWSTLGGDRWRWLAAAVAGGTVLGATRLVDENVATLLFLCVLVAALVPLVEAAASGPAERSWARSVTAAVALLVAAGLAHWLFLAVFALMLAVAIGMLVPRSLRQRAAGVTPSRTEAGTLAVAGVAAGAAMAVTVLGVLRAPTDTIQLKEDPGRFLPKLTNDAARLRLWLLGPAAAFGAWALAWREGGHPRPRRRAILLAVLAAWSAVAIAGIAYGAATKRLPPHRFLELLVVVPGVAALAEAVARLAGWVRRRSGASASAAVAVAAVALLAVPGVVAWFGGGSPKPWIDPVALSQLSGVAAWSETLPVGTPFVVLVSPHGPAGTESPALKERTVRIALPADRQAQAHVFVGSLDDLLAGRRTVTPNPAMNAAILPYWRDVEPLLSSGPPVVVVHALAPAERDPSRRPGVRSIGPGSWVLRGGASAGGGLQRRVLAPPDAFPGVVGSALWAAAFLLLLWTAGFGWTRVVVGPGAPPPVAIGLAPAIGAAALIVTGTVASRFGVPLGGVSGVAVYVATVAAGVGCAALRPAPDRQPAEERDGQAPSPS